MTVEDLDFISTLLSDPLVMRFYLATLSRDESAAWIKDRISQYESHGYSLWLVQLRATGEPVGQVGLVPQIIDGVDKPEVGYMIRSDQWRQGYAAEAAMGVIYYARTTLDMRRLVSLVRPENVPSQEMAKGLGMSIEGQTDHAGLRHDIYVIEL